MIHVHLSDLLSARAFDYLAAFLPGLFFELSIAFANPTFMGSARGRLAGVLPDNQYVKLGVVLFIAFVIGNCFMMLVFFIRWGWGHLYKFAFALRREFYSRFLLPGCNRRVGELQKAGKPSPFWLTEVHDRLKYFASEIDQHQREINACLGILTTGLLESKYGIKRDDAFHTPNWEVFYFTLATPTREEVRGEPIMTATHATGWAGLVAILLAPALRNRYYLSLSLLMVVSGLIHDFYLVRRINNPIVSRFLNIRGLLREFEKTPRAGANPSK